MSPDFLEHLQQHEWKGNIRELKNTIERAVILVNGSELTFDSLPLDLQTTNYKPRTTPPSRISSATSTASRKGPTKPTFTSTRTTGRTE